MTNVLGKEIFPGVGKLEIEDIKGQPYFSVASWIALCQKNAAEDLTNLQAIFDVCHEMGGAGLAHQMATKLVIE